MISRCRRARSARASGPKQKLVINFTILLTAKTMHALFESIAARNGSRCEAPSRSGAQCIRTSYHCRLVRRMLRCGKSMNGKPSTTSSAPCVRPATKCVPLACRRKSSRCAKRSKDSSRMWYSTCSSNFITSRCMTSTFRASLELMQVPYTGCNPRGLILARGKDLSKTLVHHRRIAVPAFAVFPMRRKIKRPARLALPLIVKSLSEDGSRGISQASIVDTRREARRARRLHSRARRNCRHSRAIYRRT